MERIDKFISNIWYGSRKDVKKYVKDGLIELNWEPVFSTDIKINFWDVVWIWEEQIEYKNMVYLMLNKKDGYVSSKRQENDYMSYLELIEDCPYAPLLNPVWRLDVDTEWLLFLTNDWELTHKMISPKKDVFKKYLVESKEELSENDIKKLESWVKIKTEKEEDFYITKPAKIEIKDKKSFYISISEGKFHQIKKMLEAVNNEVIYLKRISIWSLKLDEKLQLWEWRYLSEKEVEDLTKS